MNALSLAAQKRAGLSRKVVDIHAVTLVRHQERSIVTFIIPRQNLIIPRQRSIGTNGGLSNGAQRCCNSTAAVRLHLSV
jgi:hypothetical protein